MIEQVRGIVGAQVAEAVLRSFPEWFGLEEPRLDYIEAACALPTFVAIEDSVEVGFFDA